MTYHKFSKKFIPRFVDNDFDADAHKTFISHKAQCPDCCAAEARIRQAGIIFEQQAEARASPIFETGVGLKNNTSVTIGGSRIKNGVMLINIQGRAR